MAFGSAAVLVIVGTAGALLIDGLAGQLLAIALISIGLGGAVLLLFLEVGLSEDHQRARDESRRQREQARPEAAKGIGSSRRSHSPRWPRRPE